MKQMKNQDAGIVKFSAEGIMIENKPRIVLCASAFYFRIPHFEWRDRLEKVRAAGYNCIDVYIPWNYHETEEGCWDFEGQKDVEAYFKLAAELGLWIIARPGPYICSEWDMGSLPAYLLTKEGLVLRDYNEIYLSYVKKWYDQIMPIIENYQIGKQGTVIAVQIENELDFYDCTQVEPYIATLRDYAIDAGIVVPLVVCAGQCDIVRAGGLVDGVIPAINLYPNPKEKTVEDRIHHYINALKEMDAPLCITETSQSHFILRRELVAGAKFIAPYNQVSGTDFGFTPSVNNWGSPMTYMTHDYQFSGMINPQGECTAGYEDALLFGGLLHSLEDGISRGVSQIEDDLKIEGECELSHGIRRTLRLGNGGKLAAFANVDEKSGKVHFQYARKTRPAYSTMEVEPLNCPILPIDIPLSEFKIMEENSMLAYSTAELCHSASEETKQYLMFYTEGEAEIAIKSANIVKINADKMLCMEEDGTYIFVFSKEKTGKVEISFICGQKLILYGVSREKAVNCLKNNQFPWNMEASLDAVNESMKNTDSEQKKDRDSFLNRMHHINYQKYDLSDMGKALSGKSEDSYATCLAMEDMQYYRGYCWYEGEVILSQNQTKKGYLIYNDMDIIHFYKNKEYRSSYIGKGTHTFLPDADLSQENRITLGVRAEVWGHSNFSDSRFPAMDIRSKKGIQGMAAITMVEELSECWCYCKGEKAGKKVTLLSKLDCYNSVINFGSYNNPEQPQEGIYKKRITLQADSDALVLEMKDFNSYGKVYVDGVFVKEVQPYNSTVTLDEFSDRIEIELAICLSQKTIQESPQLKIFLYEGTHAKNIKCCGAEEKKLSDFVGHLLCDSNHEISKTIINHIKFVPGETAVLHGEFRADEKEKQGLKLSITGRDAKVLVLLNGKMLGRLWLPSEFTQAEFMGGDSTVLYLPESFMKEENQIDLLIEAMQGNPEIDQLEFISAVSK